MASSSSASAVFNLLRRLELQNVWATSSAARGWSSLSGGLGLEGRDEATVGGASAGVSTSGSAAVAAAAAAGTTRVPVAVASTSGSAALSSVSTPTARTTGPRAEIRTGPRSGTAARAHAQQHAMSSMPSMPSMPSSISLSMHHQRRSPSPEGRYLLHSRSAWMAFMSTGAESPESLESPESPADHVESASVPPQTASTTPSLDQLRERIMSMGPIKQRHLQDVYLDCATREELQAAVELTRMNYLARGELHQHDAFSNKTLSMLLQRACKLDALEIGREVLLRGARYGFGTPSTRQFNVLLIYYSKKGMLKEMVEMYEGMKSGRFAPPDSETCFILVKGFVDGGRGDVARLVVGEFEQAGVRIRDGVRLYIDDHSSV
jgi:pentatricopeptide repeat protein